MAKEDEDFKWFGDGFDGFPRNLPEDTVEYVVHVVDPKLSGAEAKSRLNAIDRAASELKKQYLKDYIWQRDDFNLQLKRENGMWCLRGQTNFGDSVADEWLVVWLLMELSKQFPDIWIQTHDNDGEFLLIEAADKLPKWLTPDVAENRVWLNTAKLFIIPQADEPVAPKALTLLEALHTLSVSPNTILHDESIDAEAFHRIRNHPSEIPSNLHSAVITIPRKLVYILHRLPSSISPATEAFYLRDPISLKALQQPDHSNLRFPPEDFVTVSTRFSKVSYAQLKSQQFAVPPAWRSAMARLMGERELSVKEVARLETGMKVVCGYEMLVCDPVRRSDKAVREIVMLLEDIESVEEGLPTDEEISDWGRMDEEDESWLDIDFTDFEREIGGKSVAEERNESAKAWTDKSAQENLRRMVERFNKFMNDEDAGLEGADLDEDDEDESDVEDDDDDVEDIINFDEQRFGNLMREMVGLPPEPTRDGIASKAAGLSGEGKAREFDRVDQAEMQDLEKAMEAELFHSGVLNLSSAPRGLGSMQKPLGCKAGQEEQIKADEPGEDEEVDIDFNLAQNLLESLKGQVGVAGPAGNLMGLLGVTMPRDEPDQKP